VLTESGLWGVPSFRLLGESSESDFCTWGQDRLWLVEEIVRRRVAPTDPSEDFGSTI
jgi:2-hydroxychromene-2-carboxylate isomerase